MPRPVKNAPHLLRSLRLRRCSCRIRLSIQLRCALSVLHCNSGCPLISSSSSGSCEIDTLFEVVMSNWLNVRRQLVYVSHAVCAGTLLTLMVEGDSLVARRQWPVWKEVRRTGWGW
jgi:hypothetical protein